MCPLASAVATRQITVQQVQVMLAVDPFEAIVGQTQRFFGRVLVDGAPASYGTEVAIYLATPTGDIFIAWAYTEEEGWYGYYPPYSAIYVEWTVPDTYDGYKLPCKDTPLAAVSLGQRNVGAPFIRISYPTRIANLTAPATVPQNVPFDISGDMQYQDAGVWKALANRTDLKVALKYDGTTIGTYALGINGHFSATTAIPTYGTFLITATFGGAVSLGGTSLTMQIGAFAITKLGVATILGILGLATMLAKGLKPKVLRR